MPVVRHRPLALALAAVATVSPPVAAAAGDPLDSPAPVEAYDHDPLTTSGRAGDVCAGRPGSGTAAAVNLIATAFAWAESGGTYSCRTSSACGFLVVDPSRDPGHFSDCWSSHALGRALDVMVGGATPDGGARRRGDELVAWLLAADGAGHQHARARRLGVQTIVWDDRCWRADRDQDVATPGEMRRCPLGHHDHVHLDLTIAGAQGRTSAYGALPEPAPSPPPPAAVAGGLHQLQAGDALGYPAGAIVFDGWLAHPGEVIAHVTDGSGRPSQHRYVTDAAGAFRAVIEGLAPGPLMLTILVAGPAPTALGTWTVTER